MAMNLLHRWLCASRWWERGVEKELNDYLTGLDFGEEVLEIGPGYGATTRVLLERVPRPTALEADGTSAQQLRARLNERVTIVHGDGTAMPFPDQSFSAVVCFTMLHHVPAIELQDALFTEALRVLRPGGMLAGYDSQLNLGFRFLHIGDTMIVLEPTTLRARLQAAGLTDIDVTHIPRRRVDFSAYKPVTRGVENSVTGPSGVT